MEDKKIVISGGAGFIGSNLSRALYKNNEVTLFLRKDSNLNNIKDILNNVDLIYGDFANPDDVKNAIKNKDYFFHLAWQTELEKSQLNPLEDLRNDLGGLLNILECCKNSQSEMKIVFASTVTVTGITDEISPNEDVREDPLSIYEANKLAAEKYLNIYWNNFKVRSSVLRLSNVFGEGQRIDNPRRGIVNYFIGRALKGNDLEIFGEGNFIRDYSHVSDYVAAFIATAENKNTDGEKYILGSGVGRTLNEVAQSIKDISHFYDSKINIKHIPFPEGENKINARNFIANNKKLKNATGWRPKKDFNEALRETYSFYLQGGRK